jgi:hypothetical protein
MILINPAYISSIEITQPFLLSELEFINGVYHKVYENEIGQIIKKPLYHLDIDNIIKGTITEDEKVYGKPKVIIYYNNDKYITVDGFKTKNEFDNYLEKLKQHTTNFLSVI